MPIKKHTQAPNGEVSTPSAGDAKTAQKLAQGLTLVPYWGYSPDSGPLAGMAKETGGLIVRRGQGEHRLCAGPLAGR